MDRVGGNRGADRVAQSSVPSGLEPEPRLRPVEPQCRRSAASRSGRAQAPRSSKTGGDLNQRARRRRSLPTRTSLSVTVGRANETCIDAAVDHHGLAHDAACSPLEIGTEAGPVDKQGCDQRGKERDDQQSSEGNQNSRQHPCHIPVSSSVPCIAALNRFLQVSGKILPGLKMLSGSRERLICRIRSNASPSSAGKKRHLALPDPMFARTGAIHGERPHSSPLDEKPPPAHVSRIRCRRRAAPHENFHRRRAPTHRRDQPLRSNVFMRRRDASARREIGTQTSWREWRARA